MALLVHFCKCCQRTKTNVRPHKFESMWKSFWLVLRRVAVVFRMFVRCQRKKKDLPKHRSVENKIIYFSLIFLECDKKQEFFNPKLTSTFQFHLLKSYLTHWHMERRFLRKAMLYISHNRKDFSEVIIVGKRSVYSNFKTLFKKTSFWSYINARHTAIIHKSDWTILNLRRSGNWNCFKAQNCDQRRKCYL